MTVSSNAITSGQAAAAHLHSLEGFLAHDPSNARLLADTFDAALAAGALDKGESLLDRGRESGMGGPAWMFRESNLRMAQGRGADARALLLRLQRENGDHPAVVHNLAYLDFADGQYAACLERLHPWMEGAAGPSPALEVTHLAALQVLWLRALHRQGALDGAWSWIQAQLQRGDLSAPAAGIASLIAIDAGHMDSVINLSERALAQDSRQMEALVARATVALAFKDPTLARSLLETALAQNPSDGRALSAAGFTELLTGALPQARSTLEKSVALMPGHVGTWIGLGWTCFLLQDMQGAARAFEQSLALDRNFGESHGSLAVVQAVTGQQDAARQSIDRALGLDKSNLSARYAAAVLGGQASDPASIQKLARRLLSGRVAPMGDDLAGWLPPEVPAHGR